MRLVPRSGYVSRVNQSFLVFQVTQSMNHTDKFFRICTAHSDGILIKKYQYFSVSETKLSCYCLLSGVILLRTLFFRNGTITSVMWLIKMIQDSIDVHLHNVAGYEDNSVEVFRYFTALIFLNYFIISCKHLSRFYRYYILIWFCCFGLLHFG